MAEEAAVVGAKIADGPFAGGGGDEAVFGAVAVAGETDGAAEAAGGEPGFGVGEAVGGGAAGDGGQRGAVEVAQREAGTGVVFARIHLAVVV